MGTLIGCENEEAKTQRLLNDAKQVDARYREALAYAHGKNLGELLSRMRERRMEFYGMPTKVRLAKYRTATERLIGARSDAPPQKVATRAEVEYTRVQRKLDTEILRGIIYDDWSGANNAATQYRQAEEDLKRETRLYR